MGISEWDGYVSHAFAVKRMHEATVLLLTIRHFPGASGTVTGKIFEYLASGRPILGTGPVDGDAANLLDETGSGRMCAQSDAEGIETNILDLYRSWKSDGLPGFDRNERIDRFSRRSQTGLLADILSAAMPVATGKEA